MFITFEGLDGTGKTTIINKLKEFLPKHFPNYEFVFTREPGGNDLIEAEQIRKMILDPNNHIDPLSEAVLFTASRSIHLNRIIRPALEKQKIVICDRFVDSSLAYQGSGQNIGVEKIKKLNDLIVGDTNPNFTFFFHLSPAEARKRLISQDNHSADRIERNTLDFFERVYKCYLDLAKQEPNRFINIDVNQSVEVVFENVKTKIISCLETIKTGEK